MTAKSNIPKPMTRNSNYNHGAQRAAGGVMAATRIISEWTAEGGNKRKNMLAAFFPSNARRDLNP